MHWKIVKYLKLSQYRKKKPYKLYGLEETETTYNKGKVTHEIKPRQIRLNGVRQKINFDITNLEEHCIILGRRWLKGENPQIHWKEGKIYLRGQEILQATAK